MNSSTRRPCGFTLIELLVVAAFLDGNGRYRQFDTRFVFGSNWTIWPNNPWRGTW